MMDAGTEWGPAEQAASRELDDLIRLVLRKLVWRHPHWPESVRADIAKERDGELYLVKEITEFWELVHLLAEMNGRRDDAVDRMANKLLEDTNLRAMDFRNGMSMEIEPARALAAAFVGAARAMLGEAPNYSETPVEMTTSLAADPDNPATWEKFAFIVQRVGLGKLTPHEARMAAERRAEQAENILRDLADSGDCCFDHHGGCQAHGHLSLEPGERCPHARAKALLADLDQDKD